MNIYPWVVIRVTKSERVNTRERDPATGEYLLARQQYGNEDQEFTGELMGDAYVHWCENEAIADGAIAALLKLYPQNVYVKAESREAWVPPVVKAERVKFSKEGLLPA